MLLAPHMYQDKSDLLEHLRGCRRRSAKLQRTRRRARRREGEGEGKGKGRGRARGQGRIRGMEWRKGWAKQEEAGGKEQEQGQE